MLWKARISMRILTWFHRLKNKIAGRWYYVKCIIRQSDDEINYKKKNCPGCYMGIFQIFDPHPCEECPYYKYREESKYCKKDVNTIVESCKKEVKNV